MRPNKLHIIICGLTDGLHSKTKALKKWLTQRENISALRFKSQIPYQNINYSEIPHDLIISYSPNDVFRHSQLSQANTLERVDYHFMIQIFNPISYLLHKIKILDAYDYADYFPKSIPGRKLMPLTQPGVIPTLSECLKVLSLDPNHTTALGGQTKNTDWHQWRPKELNIWLNQNRNRNHNRNRNQRITSKLKNFSCANKLKISQTAIASAKYRKIKILCGLFPELEILNRKIHASPREYNEKDLINTNHPISTIIEGTIIGFHTPDELYTKEAERLKTSLDRLKLKYEIFTYCNDRKWVNNCACKPDLILEARKKIRGTLLYVDVDAILHKNPWLYLTRFPGDIGACILSNGTLLSGTILIRDTPGAIIALQNWSRKQKQSASAWDQKNLQITIEEELNKTNPRFSFSSLPSNLAFIFDREYSFLYGDIFIEHLQASRQAKQLSTDTRHKRIKEIEIFLNTSFPRQNALPLYPYQ